MNTPLTAPPAAPSAEECRQRFRAACRSGPLPAVADLRRWLEPFPAADRPDVLADLVSEHLQCSWEIGRGVLLEQYVKEFGGDFEDYASAAELPADLVEVEFIARHEFDRSSDHPALDDYARRFPDRPEVLEQLESRCLDGGRYVKVRVQGQGGLGMVWLAFDRHLGRYVAIKEPQPAIAGDEEILRRLAQEARVTARLDHPAIVAVHELHPPGADLPYYVMRLVQGRTLRELIQDYHGSAATGDSGAQRLRWNQLLRAFCTVCDAVAHAHSRGVLHRDLKPHNVILGEFGETVVLDWGLAKPFPAEGGVPATAAGPAVASPVSQALTGTVVYAPTPVSAAPTPPGAAVGTIQYMAPEQARGNADQRSDLFGLGAVLYEVLTGQPPYEKKEGETIAQLLDRVAEARYPRPRDRRPGVSRALEAVCLKAMAPRPEERYGSASEMGRDVERWLADEPVTCYRDPWLQRLARSARRHQQVTGALLFAFPVLLIGIWLWVAEARRQGVRQKVERLLKGGEDLIAAGQPQAAKTSLIEAQALLTELGEAGGQRERVEQALCQAEARGRQADFLKAAGEAEYHLLGDYWALRPHERAEKVRPILRREERSVDLKTGVVRADKALALYGLPGDLKPIQDLAAQGFEHREIAALHQRAGELLFLQALGLERLRQGRPKSEWQAGLRRAVRLLVLAEAVGNHSRILYQFRARFQQALGKQRAAAADRRRAEQARPVTFLDHHFKAAEHHWAGRSGEAVAEFQLALAVRPNEFWTLFRLARDLEQLNQLDQAESLLRNCSVLRPNDPKLHNNRGLIRFRQRRWDEAIKAYEEALHRQPDYLMAYANLMLVHAESKQPARAEAVWRRLLARNPSPQEQAQGQDTLGVAYERVGKLDLALAHYTRAVRLDPNFARALSNRAIILGSLGRAREAEEDLRRALQLQPKDAETWFALGSEYARQKRYPQAIDAFTRAIQFHPKFWKAWYNRGVVFRMQKRYQKALDDQNRVLELTPLPDALHERALTLASTGNYQQALTDVNQALALNDRDASYLRTRGQIWADIGGPTARAQSEADLTLAIALQPREPAGYRARGVAREKAGIWQGTLADYRHYLRLQPQAPDAADIYNSLCKAHHELGEIEAALTAVNAALERGTRPAYLSNRANLFLLQGHLARAVADCDRAIRLDAEQKRAWALRGRARLLQGSYEAAVADLDRALQLQPGFYETLVTRAVIHHARGDDRAARKDLASVAPVRLNSVRVKFARGLLNLLDRKFPEAITGLSQAVDDPVLGPLSLSLRARAWLEMGGTSLSAASADANHFAQMLSAEGHAHLEAARIHARAAELAAAEVAAPLRDRALALLEQALKLRQDLRPRLATDPDLKGLRSDPRFKKLTD
jgi:tetratricopeptide (TPR) repeat protein/serine/threonine protein kinase